MSSGYGTGATAAPQVRGPHDFAWLVGQFAEEVPGVAHVLVVSLDGLQLTASAHIPRDLGDQLAALTAGLLSMADQSGALLGLGSSEYVTIRLPLGYLLFMRLGEAAGLATVAGVDGDLRVIAYQMSKFAASVGHLLTPRMRDELHRLTAAPVAR
jgi:predicted regulator of Ras-like GTPase activity (Roadblock/LC7/MglB family)